MWIGLLVACCAKFRSFGGYCGCRAGQRSRAYGMPDDIVYYGFDRCTIILSLSCQTKMWRGLEMCSNMEVIYLLALHCLLTGRVGPAVARSVDSTLLQAKRMAIFFSLNTIQADSVMLSGCVPNVLKVTLKRSPVKLRPLNPLNNSALLCTSGAPSAPISGRRIQSARQCLGGIA